MGKIALVFIIVMASATFYLTSSIYKSSKPTAQTAQQHTWLDESGKVHVMGITLGESTVRDAEKAFRSRADAAVFMYPLAHNGSEQTFHLELEAYFPAIADHSKIMLKLALDDATLEQVRQRSTSPRMYPNGVARRNLASEDILAVQKMVVRELTLIPSIQLELKILKAQFGEPSNSEQHEQDVVSYTFPKLGLKATINPNGKDKLVFKNPLKL